jgi:flagellar biogenesis protein FliO
MDGPTATPSDGTLPDAGKQNAKFLALCLSGAFVLFAGLFLPKLLTESPNPEARSTALTVPSDEKAIPSQKDNKLIETAKPSEAPSLTGILVRLTFGTFFVLGLCALTAWGIGKWVRGQQQVQSNGMMKMVASLRVNRTVALHLVQVGEQQFLLGVDTGGLRSVLPMPESFEEKLEESRVQEAHGIPVPRLLSHP